MKQKNYNKISINSIAEYADPFAIKNFILSSNIPIHKNISYNEPFLVDSFIFGICIKGNGKIKINFKEYEIIPNSILVVLPNQIVDVVEQSDDLILETLFVSFDFIADFPFPKDIQILINLEEWPCMHVSREIMQDLIEYHTIIVKQYNQVNQPYRIEIVKGLLYTMIMELFGIYIEKKNNLEKASSRQEELVGQFFKLLMTNFREERSVSFYANKLCITPKYLSSTVKKVTGKTILLWIHEITLIEAKTLLKTSSMTVLQISEYLNFPTPSFFGRFFKEHTEITPLKYREMH